MEPIGSVWARTSSPSKEDRDDMKEASAGKGTKKTLKHRGKIRIRQKILILDFIKQNDYREYSYSDLRL